MEPRRPDRRRGERSAAAEMRRATRSRPHGAALAALASLLALAGCGPPVPNLDSNGTRIVCFGDSITAGVGRGDDPAYPELLARELGAEVVNAGVPGDTAAAGLLRIDEALVHDPWVIVVGLGGNDLLRQVPIEDTEAALAAIVERILAAGAVPVLLEVHGPFGGRHRRLFDRLHDRYGAPVVRDVVADVLTDPRLKSDRVHPNGEGYRRIAAAVAETLRPMVAERTRRR